MLRCFIRFLCFSKSQTEDHVLGIRADLGPKMRFLIDFGNKTSLPSCVQSRDLNQPLQYIEHDFNFKLNHAKKFLSDGCKLKAYVFFKGRQIIFKDKGEMKLLKLAQELQELAKVDQLTKLEGKKMNMLLTPLK